MSAQTQLATAVELLRAVARQVGHDADEKQRARGLSAKTRRDVERFLTSGPDDRTEVSPAWLQELGFRQRRININDLGLELWRYQTDELPAVRWSLIESRDGVAFGELRIWGVHYSGIYERGEFLRLLVGLGFKQFGGE